MAKYITIPPKGAVEVSAAERLPIELPDDITSLREAEVWVEGHHPGWELYCRVFRLKQVEPGVWVKEESNSFFADHQARGDFDGATVAGVEGEWRDGSRVHRDIRHPDERVDK